VLSRHSPLTLAMIVRLREKMGISADILIGPHRRAA
jgi:antitoxin component HigA of HigAB toxin-antitoxin module